MKVSPFTSDSIITLALFLNQIRVREGDVLYVSLIVYPVISWFGVKRFIITEVSFIQSLKRGRGNVCFSNGLTANMTTDQPIEWSQTQKVIYATLTVTAENNIELRIKD